MNYQKLKFNLIAITTGALITGTVVWVSSRNTIKPVDVIELAGGTLERARALQVLSYMPSNRDDVVTNYYPNLGESTHYKYYTTNGVAHYYKRGVSPAYSVIITNVVTNDLYSPASAFNDLYTFKQYSDERMIVCGWKTYVATDFENSDVNGTYYYWTNDWLESEYTWTNKSGVWLSYNTSEHQTKIYITSFIAPDIINNPDEDCWGGIDLSTFVTNDTVNYPYAPGRIYGSEYIQTNALVDAPVYSNFVWRGTVVEPFVRKQLMDNIDNKIRTLYTGLSYVDTNTVITNWSDIYVDATDLWEEAEAIGTIDTSKTGKDRYRFTCDNLTFLTASNTAQRYDALYRLGSNTCSHVPNVISNFIVTGYGESEVSIDDAIEIAITNLTVSCDTTVPDYVARYTHTKRWVLVSTVIYEAWSRAVKSELELSGMETNLNKKVNFYTYVYWDNTNFDAFGSGYSTGIYNNVGSSLFCTNYAVTNWIGNTNEFTAGDFYKPADTTKDWDVAKGYKGKYKKAILTWDFNYCTEEITR